MESERVPGGLNDAHVKAVPRVEGARRVSEEDQGCCRARERMMGDRHRSTPSCATGRESAHMKIA
jgi:hypothetical protein